MVYLKSSLALMPSPLCSSQTWNSRHGTASCPAPQGTGMAQAKQMMPNNITSPSLSLTAFHHPPTRKVTTCLHSSCLSKSVSPNPLFFSPIQQSYNIQFQPSKFQIIFSLMQPQLINYCKKISFGMHVTKSGCPTQPTHTLEYHLLSESRGINIPGASAIHLRYRRSCVTVLSTNSTVTWTSEF